MEFERLIETERANEALLQRAREEAILLRAEARREIEERAASLQAELSRAIAASESAIADRQTTELARIASESHTAIERYRQITDTQVATAVSALMEQLVGEGPST